MHNVWLQGGDCAKGAAHRVLLECIQNTDIFRRRLSSLKQKYNNKNGFTQIIKVTIFSEKTLLSCKVLKVKNFIIDFSSVLAIYHVGVY